MTSICSTDGIRDLIFIPNNLDVLQHFLLCRHGKKLITNFRLDHSLDKSNLTVGRNIRKKGSYLYNKRLTVDFEHPDTTPSTLWKCPPPRMSRLRHTICSGEKGRPLSLGFSKSPLSKLVILVTLSLERRKRFLNSLSGIPKQSGRSLYLLTYVYLIW